MADTLLTRADLPDLALGCAVFGTGGGGDIAADLLAADHALAVHGDVPLIRFADLPPDSLVLPLSMIGAPTAGLEMLGSGREAATLRAEVERATGRPVAAVMALEIGGANGLAPVGWAAQLGLPLLDADGMGRAFPELQMVSMHVMGIPADTVFMVDALGNTATLRPVDSAWSERWARALCVASGASALIADYQLTGDDGHAVIHGSVSRALRVGRLLRTAERPVDALVAELGATRLMTGTVEDVVRDTRDGFVKGALHVRGHGTDQGRRITVDLQNENLVAREDGTVLAGVPDLIGVLDTETGIAVATEALRYGQRVTVLAWPCDPLWRTPRGLETAGPAAFGYAHPYVPVGSTHPPVGSTTPAGSAVPERQSAR
ncbi:DUF917 domain-containing protein [Kitasatospora indigofera]|uniref:DUF917 domain-containing protein n=1 Tax=Kitasatospora indigofera TaxID=67307 RepID=UPI00367811EE